MYRFDPTSWLCCFAFSLVLVCPSSVSAQQAPASAGGAAEFDKAIQDREGLVQEFNKLAAEGKSDEAVAIAWQMLPLERRNTFLARNSSRSSRQAAAK